MCLFVGLCVRTRTRNRACVRKVMSRTPCTPLQPSRTSSTTSNASNTTFSINTSTVAARRNLAACMEWEGLVHLLFDGSGGEGRCDAQRQRQAQSLAHVLVTQDRHLQARQRLVI